MSKRDNKMQIEVPQNLEKPAFMPKTKGRPDNPLYHMTFKIPRASYKRLKDAAEERQTTLQDFVALAVDEMMRNEGLGAFDPDGVMKKK